jgi:hypothetical protein
MVISLADFLRRLETSAFPGFLGAVRSSREVTPIIASHVQDKSGAATLRQSVPLYPRPICVSLKASGSCCGPEIAFSPIRASQQSVENR